MTQEELTAIFMIAVIVGLMFAFMSGDYGGSRVVTGIISGTITFVVAYGTMALMD